MRWGLSVLLLLLPGLVWAQSPVCRNVRINHQGSSGAPIVVDATAGGVTIVEKNSSRCGFTLINETSNPIRCAPATGRYILTVTSGVGLYVAAGVYPVFGTAGQEQWKCIQATGTAASLSVAEDMP